MRRLVSSHHRIAIKKLLESLPCQHLVTTVPTGVRDFRHSLGLAEGWPAEKVANLIRGGMGEISFTCAATLSAPAA